MIFLQMCTFGLILTSACVIFYKVSEPKSIIDDAGSDLIYEFRKINKTSHEVS